MIRWVLIVMMVVVGALVMAQMAEAAELWRDSNYPYRREITIENDNMDSTLSNFTVLIKIADADPPGLAEANIADGRYTFYDSSGNELHFENESYSEAGTYVAMETWVEIGTLNSDNNTATDDSIWIYYGYDGGDQDDGSSAWDTDGNWVGVWHMDDAAGPTVTDSTGTNNGTAQNTPTFAQTGQVDGAITFASASSEYVINTTDDFEFTTSFTASAWVRADSAPAWARVLDHSTYSSPRNGWFIGWYDDNQVYEWRLEDVGGADGTVATGTITLDQWYHIIGVYDKDNELGILYSNGVEVDRQTTSGTQDYTSVDDFGIGARLNPTTTATEFFNGTIDEVRISSSARSAEWIKFAHANMGGQADNELSVGSEEEPDNFTWVGDTDSNWSTDLNWYGGSAPGSDDVAIFDSYSGAVNCTIDASINVAGIDINTGYTGTITQGAGNTVTVGTSNYNQEAGTFTGGDSAITMNGSYTLAGGTFTSTSGTLKCQDTFDTSAGGTFTHNSGTVEATGISKAWDVSTSLTLNNLTINKSSGSNVSIPSADTLVVSGTLTLTDGKFNGGTIDLDGTISIAATFDGGTGKILVDGAGDQSFTIPDDTGMCGINLNSSTTTITVGTGGTVTIEGNVTLQSGTLDPNGGTIGVVGVNCTWNVDTSFTLNNLTVNKAGDANKLTITSGDTLVVAGTLTLTNGKVDNGTVQAQGAVSIASTFDGGSGILQFTGADDQIYTDSGGTVMTGSPVTINKSAGTVTLASNLALTTAGQDVTITEGTLDLAGYDLTLTSAGDVLTVDDGGILKLQGDETVTASTVTLNTGSTVAYDGAAAAVTVRDWPYKTLTLDAPDKQFNWTGGTTYTVAETLNINGTSGNEVTLRSTDASDWGIDIASGGTQAISYVDVDKSDASAGETVYASNSTDQETNTNWVFTSQIVTWDGSESTDWNTAANWDLNFVPRASDDVIIPDVSGASGNSPVMAQARTENALTINNGAALNLGGNNLTSTTNITCNGTLTATGTEVITVGGNWDFANGTFTAASSNVTFNGATDSCTIDPGASEFKTLTVDKTDTADTVKVVNNSLTIGSNTLIIKNGEFEVTTDSTFNEDIEVQDGGTFVCQTSLVTLTFASGINFTVQSGGRLVLNGQNFDEEIKLRSGTNGSRWNLILQDGSSHDIKYVDVKDSDASGGNRANASFSIDSGNNVNWSFLGGVVYDSQTGDRVKDALVTLFKADSTIYTGSPQPNPQTSDAQGNFFFEVAAGKYYLEARHKDYKDYNGSAFILTGSSVNENIEMEPLDLKTGQYLSIAKTVNKKTASIGDILTYTIKAKNIDSSLTATNVSITDSLPHDFKYVKGTSRLDNTFIADPSNRRTPSWLIGSLGPKESKTLTYRIIAGPDVKLGKNKNSAIINGTVGGSSTSAGPSVAPVDIKEGLFTKRGMVIGKVFNDIDQDGIQDMDEEGIPYVALILEDGTMVTTDEFGRFSIPDVAQGMHVLRLDQRMLPGGPLTKEGVEEAADASTYGVEAAENLIERRSLGGWVKEKLYDKDEIVSGASRPRNDGPCYRSDIPEVSDFVQVPESGTAKANFPIRLLTLLEEKLQKERHAKETQFMIVGIADGTLGHLTSSGKVENIAKGDNIGMSLEVEDSFYTSGKVVLYARGKIKGEYLLTTRYDSTRDYHDHLYSWVNPEKYYPIYGDKATLINDADSQGKFFIRVDKDSSYAMIGNYKTDEFTKTELSKYSRTLGGVTTHIKSEDFIREDKGKKEKISGELSFFGAKTLQEQRQDIFQGRGISGPYYLTRIPILEETERVKIEVRDKSKYDTILKTEAKSRDADYEIDYETGRLMFREPVPTYDENNDPVYIVCDYEYFLSPDDDKHYITGSRGELTLFDDRLKVGSQIITEDREEYFYNLIGVDSVWQITPNTRLAGEWAHSKKTEEEQEGDALRIEGTSTLFNNKLRLQSYATQIGKEFLNPVNVREAGIQKYGATGELDITRGLSLITDHWTSRSIGSKISDRQTKTDLIYDNDRLFLSTGYGFDETVDEKDEIDDIYKHKMNLRGGLKLTENVIASTGYSWQRELYEKKFKKEIDVLSPRLDIKVDEDTSVYGRHDYTREKTRGTDKRLTNHVSSVGFMTDKDSKRSYVEYGLVGGKIDSTTFGTEQDIPINDKVTITSHSNQVITKDKNEEIMGYKSKVEVLKDLYVGGNFERVKATGDTDYEETAVSVTVDYLKSEDSAVGTKFEFRDAKTKREYNLGVDSRLNIDDATYFLTKAEYHKERDHENKEDLREQKRIIGGLGYRPIDNDKLNLLAKYEYKEDLDNTSISKSDYASHIASMEGIYDITPKWGLFGKYALKSALEDASGIATHSLTDLKTTKLTYRFNPYIDAAGIYRILQNYSTDTIKQGAAGEVGVTIFNHLRVAAGYNFLDYSDREYPDEDYQGVGPYIQMTYKFLDDVDKLLESREEMLKKFADESALALYTISQIPGDEKFVEEMMACYTQAMKWYKFGKYEESLECLHQGLEAYYAAKIYGDGTKERKEEFLFYLRQGEKFYEYGLKDKAFKLLEKAYKINAYDKGLLALMTRVRDEIGEEKAKRRKIFAMKLEGIEKIARLEDDTRLVLETVKLHLKVGKGFYSIGDYENAISEWKEGIAIAMRASEDYFQMKEEREILVKELESIYNMALLHWKRRNYMKSKGELERGLSLIDETL